MKDDPPLYTRSQIQKRLSISERTLRKRLIALGILPHRIYKNEHLTKVFYYNEEQIDQLTKKPSTEENDTEHRRVSKDSIVFSCVSDKDKPKQLVFKFIQKDKNCCNIQIHNRTNKSFYTLNVDNMLYLAEEIKKKYAGN